MACLSTEEPRLDLDLQCHNVLVDGGRVVIEFQFEESFALTSLGDDFDHAEILGEFDYSGASV